MLWLCCFLGGLLAGTGVFLAALIEVIRHVRHQVYELSFFARIVGKLTFTWRGPDERIALVLDEIPEEYLRHSARAAGWLVGIGLLGIALAVPLLLRLGWRFRRWRAGEGAPEPVEEPRPRTSPARSRSRARS
jgi:MFS family permease